MKYNESFFKLIEAANFREFRLFDNMLYAPSKEMIGCACVDYQTISLLSITVKLQPLKNK